jgi:hypothetical protein
MPKQTAAASPSTPPAQHTGKGGGGTDWKKYGARSADDGDRIVWRAGDEGDTLTGTFARVDEVQTRCGVKVVLELDDCRNVIAGGEDGADGAYTIWPTPGLINAFADAMVGKGDRVLISLDELIDVSKGNAYKKFSVEVLDPDAEPF